MKYTGAMTILGNISQLYLRKLCINVDNEDVFTVSIELHSLVKNTCFFADSYIKGSEANSGGWRGPPRHPLSVSGGGDAEVLVSVSEALSECPKCKKNT